VRKNFLSRKKEQKEEVADLFTIPAPNESAPGVTAGRLSEEAEAEFQE
jgi:hypothetical protein